MSENARDLARQGGFGKITEGVLDIHRGNFSKNNDVLPKNIAFAAKNNFDLGL